MTTHTLLNRLQQKSHYLRGQRVVLDADVATMYGVSTGYLRRAIARHRTRFPPEYIFKMSEAEQQAFGKKTRGTFDPTGHSDQHRNNPRVVRNQRQLINSLRLAHCCRKK